MTEEDDKPNVAVLDIKGLPADAAGRLVTATVAWNCASVARQSAFGAGQIPNVHRSILLGIAILAADLIQFMTKEGHKDIPACFEAAVKDAIERKLTAKKALEQSGLPELVAKAFSGQDPDRAPNGKRWM